MTKSSATYQSLTKITATLLLVAFLIPSGLQAKQLMDFCMMDMKHHSTPSAETHTGHPENTPAPDNHCDSHSDSESKTSSQTQNHCDLELICACNMGKSHLSEQKWVPSTLKFDVRLTRQNDLPPYYATGVQPAADQKIRIGEYDPPLWLLYDTFLM